MIDANVIGKRIAVLRGTKSREEVTRALGISLSALAMYETSKRVPRDEIKVAIASYFGVSVESLFFA